MLDQQKLARTLKHVGRLLVAGNYAELASLAHHRRLTADELRNAVANYGRRLVLPPQNVWAARNVVAIEAAVPEAWSAYVDLWTAEEGRSDLTLELTLRESPHETYDVEIDDLHVL